MEAKGGGGGNRPKSETDCGNTWWEGMLSIIRNRLGISGEKKGVLSLIRNLEHHP